MCICTHIYIHMLIKMFPRIYYLHCDILAMYLQQALFTSKSPMYLQYILSNILYAPLANLLFCSAFYNLYSDVFVILHNYQVILVA